MAEKFWDKRTDSKKIQAKDTMQDEGGLGTISDTIPADVLVKVTPDEAAEVLLTYLPEETQMLIREAQHGMAKPLWQMLLGYVMRCRDNQHVWFPFFLSMWDSGLPATEPRPCGTCGQPFKGPVAEARYCCAPCFFGKLAEFGHSDACFIKPKAVLMATH